jgi:hypothetical protein
MDMLLKEKWREVIDWEERGVWFFEKIYGMKKVLNRKIQNPLEYRINSW